MVLAAGSQGLAAPSHIQIDLIPAPSQTGPSVAVGNGPLFAAYDSANGYLYVTNWGSDNLSVINGTMLVGSVTTGVGVGNGPYSVVFDSQDDEVYASSVGGDNVSVVNGTVLVGSVGVGIEPRNLTYDSEDGYVYVSNDGSGNLSVINGTTLVGSVNVGSEPGPAVFDNRNGYVYVATSGSYDVSVINGLGVIGSVNVGGVPQSPSYDGWNGYVYVPNLNPGIGPDNVSIIDGTALIGSVNIGVDPNGTPCEGENGYLYVPNAGSANVSVINGSELVGSVNVGSGPTSAICDSGNRYVYVVNEGSNNVSVINGTNVLAWLGVGSRPYSAIYVGESGYVYVPNEGSNNVSIIFTPPSYSASFTEMGLPIGTNWSVALGGTQQTSMTPTIEFAEPNGSYSYTVQQVNGYGASPTSGSLTMNGASAAISVTFTLEPPCSVTFTESGLLSGTNWSVRVTGTGSYAGLLTNFSSSDSIQFHLPGYFTGLYLVEPVSGFVASPSNGTLALTGSPATVPIIFGALPIQRFQVTFAEAGLPPGTEWWVNITGGNSNSSVTGTVSFSEPNGSYFYSLSSTAKTYTAPGGVLNVNGTVVSKTAVFSQESTWLNLNLAGPSNRSSFAFTYATPTHGPPYALLFGGRRGNLVLSDTWTFSNGVWHKLALKVHPPPTRYGMLVWDAADNYAVLFGGSSTTAYMNDTWVFSAGHWTQLHPEVSPPARRSGGLVYDAADGYVLLWGGHAGAFNYQPGYVMFNDTWTFHRGIWTNVTRRVAPTPASEPSLAYDPLVGAVIEFGGYNQSGVNGYHGLNATWVYRAGTWTNLRLTYSPWARDGAATAYDPELGGVIIAGGQDEGVPGHGIMNDTWLLSGTTVGSLSWTQMHPVRSFPPMDSAMAVYDGQVGGILMFGGVGSMGKVLMHWYGTTWLFV